MTVTGDAQAGAHIGSCERGRGTTAPLGTGQGRGGGGAATAAAPPTCVAAWDQGEWSFRCQLPTGHTGPHEESSQDEGTDAYVVRWADEPWRRGGRRDLALGDDAADPGRDAVRAEVEQLREVLASRTAIEQAKGILMERRGCTANEAFEMLKRASQRENVKLREIAARIVAKKAAEPRDFSPSQTGRAASAATSGG